MSPFLIRIIMPQLCAFLAKIPKGLNLNSPGCNPGVQTAEKNSTPEGLNVDSGINPTIHSSIHPILVVAASPRWVYSCPLVVSFLVLSAPLMAADGKIYKVLPHFVDKQGRHTLSPSLYERDAYQAQLRLDSELRGGLRFDVHWKARKSDALKLRVDMRGSLTNDATNVSVEVPLKRPGLFSKWSAVHLTKEDYSRLGELRSWRATLLDGDHVLAEQRSFLW